MSTEPDVLIIGGGIWGLSTAFHLARTGRCKVRLVERNSSFAQETTVNAAGQIGQIRSSPVVTRAIAYGLDLLESFPATYGHDPGLRRRGSLFIGLSEQRITYFDRQVALGRRNGLPIDWVEPGETVRWVEGLRPEKILGGYFVHGDGYVDSAQTAHAFAAAARDLGADLRTGVHVHELVTDSGRVVAVNTNVGRMSAERVIVAAGPWTTALLRHVDVPVPAQPIRHQRARTEATPIPDHQPVLRVPDLSSYVRPEEPGLTFGHFEAEPWVIDTDEVPPTFRSSDLLPATEVLERARRTLGEIYPLIRQREVVEYRRGLVTVAPDGAYVLDRAPEWSNVYFATGCSALGIAGSAAIGRWLAEWIVVGEKPADLAEFSLDRFGGRYDDREVLRHAARETYAAYYAIQPPP